MPAKSIIYHGIPIERCDGQLFSDEEVATAERDEKQRLEEIEYWKRYFSIVGQHVNPIVESAPFVPSGGGHMVAVVTKMPDLNFPKSE